MRLPAAEISHRARVGTYKGRPAYALSVVGGLHVVAASDGEVLGAGSHPGVARHLAKRREGMVFDALAKSETLDPRYFGSELPQGEVWTAQLRRGR